VDPDNRRLVDYPKRRAVLAELKERVEASQGDLLPLSRELLETSWDGRIKLYFIYRTLQARRRAPKIFSEGIYFPLEGEGEKRDHLCAFARILKEDSIVVGIPRLVVGLLEGREELPLGESAWKDTWLRVPGEWAGRKYRNLFTGEELDVRNGFRGAGFPLGDLFRHFPVALLESTEPY
jgi:(1->4)-alpha-D-glucan 1-alpha-D-glucosylmutase